MAGVLFYGRSGMVDMPLTLWCTLSVLAFERGLRAADLSSRRVWLLLFYVLLGEAMLVIPLVKRALPEARLPEEDPIGRQVAARLVEMILPTPSRGGRATLVLPRDAAPGEPTYEFFTRLLRLHGYETHAIPAVLALVLAELEGDQYSGVAVSFGAGTVSMGLAHRGELVARAVIDRGGDWIDQRLCERFRRTLFDPAGRQFLDLDRGSWMNYLVGDFTRPALFDANHALASTSRGTVRLTRGTPSPEDDIPVLSGQTLLVTTGRPTALASRIGKPKPSYVDAKTTMSQRPYSSTTCSTGILLSDENSTRHLCNAAVCRSFNLPITRK